MCVLFSVGWEQTPCAAKTTSESANQGEKPSCISLPGCLSACLQVGTYSCHGVEPSYNGVGDDDEGVTAKINQDRGCVVYPFNGDARHALFSVFDGE